MHKNKHVLSCLKFIANIKVNEKINLRYLSLQEDGFFTQLLRTLNQDNRQKTLVFIDETIHKAFELIKCYENSKLMSEKIMCDNLILDLKSSREGIQNLKKTYNTDLKFICDLNCLLEFIDANLLELSPRLPILSPSSNGTLDDLPPPPPYMSPLSLPPPSTEAMK
jgi:hypothetical protein